MIVSCWKLQDVARDPATCKTIRLLSLSSRHFIGKADLAVLVARVSRCIDFYPKCEDLALFLELQICLKIFLVRTFLETCLANREFL